MKKIAVIGSGQWGTTLAGLLYNKGYDIHLWTHSNRYLPDTPASVSHKLDQVLDHTSMVIIAVASDFYRQVVTQMVPYLDKHATVLSATKGLEQKTEKRMSEILTEVFPSSVKIAVLSGPNLSREIREKKPAAAVVASHDEPTSLFFQQLLSTDFFRIYTNHDVTGVELGGTLKNILAIAGGIVDGFSLGDNAKAAILVRGLAEITRLGVALGAEANTFFGLTGLGDMIATCFSVLSRNHQVGVALSQGETLSDISHRMMEVAEGISSTRVAYALSKKYEVDTPIINEIYYVLYDNKSPSHAMQSLMIRDLKKE